MEKSLTSASAESSSAVEVIKKKCGDLEGRLEKLASEKERLEAELGEKGPYCYDVRKQFRIFETCGITQPLPSFCVLFWYPLPNGSLSVDVIYVCSQRRRRQKG